MSRHGAGRSRGLALAGAVLLLIVLSAPSLALTDPWWIAGVYDGGDADGLVSAVAALDGQWPEPVVVARPVPLAAEAVVPGESGGSRHLAAPPPPGRGPPVA